VPIYEYRCGQCGHQFEAVQRMSDDPLTECEVCGGQVARLLFAPAIHFKGTGFHNTDYVSKKRSGGDDGGGKDEGGAKDGAGKDGAAVSTNGSAPAGDAPKVKEATPKDTAARTTGP
jgi:putative FmdB family regulatory protein